MSCDLKNSKNNFLNRAQLHFYFAQTAIFSSVSSLLSDGYYLEKAKSAERKFPTKVKCFWTVPGSFAVAPTKRSKYFHQLKRTLNRAEEI